jgi:HEAT repeat protein
MPNEQIINKRGKADKEQENRVNRMRDSEIEKLLETGNPAERTAAAVVTGKRKFPGAVAILCGALQRENALYSKIAICEALASMGEAALTGLIPLIGKIGNNRHEKLPEKGFYKLSYPLPRDIAARTIIRIGEPALPYLDAALKSADDSAVSEAVDAAGHISFYANNAAMQTTLLELYGRKKDNEVLIWKILRSFMAFNTARVNRILEETIRSSPVPAFRWEAVRSRALNGLGFESALAEFILNDKNGEVKKIYNWFSSKM